MSTFQIDQEGTLVRRLEEIRGAEPFSPTESYLHKQ